TPADVKAGQRPHSHIVDPAEVTRAVVEPRPIRAWGELAPANGQLPVERQQSGRRAGVDHFPQRVPVLFARAFLVSGTDPPVHAPTPVAGTGRAEQLFQRGPQPRGHRKHRERHALTMPLRSRSGNVAMWPGVCRSAWEPAPSPAVRTSRMFNGLTMSPIG